jgi:hypothetical protein
MIPPALFVTSLSGKELEQHIQALDKATSEWTLQAARGECSWVCSDCCVTFPDGMPDACVHGHQSCTNIIQRDKRDASIEEKLKEKNT